MDRLHTLMIAKATVLRSIQKAKHNEKKVGPMAKATIEIPADKMKLYEKLVATNSEVELRGAAMPYTSVNGHMFSFLTRTGAVALRLPDAEREAFLKKYKTELCEQHGTVLKEYAVVPDALLKKTSELKIFFQLSFGYVQQLKPKPTKRKKSAKKKKA